MDKNQKRIARFLSDYGLVAEQFGKADVGTAKTPDFRVRGRESGDHLFYCEVKSIQRDGWLDRKFEEAKPEELGPEELVGGARKDPIFNRLTDDIHKAAKQFAAVNATVDRPNVLAFVNHDRKCGFLDLIAVLTGNFMAEGGKAIPTYPIYSEGRVKDDKANIHLFLWVDDYKPTRLLFAQNHENHHLLLCGYFGMDPGAIVQINS